MEKEARNIWAIIEKIAVDGESKDGIWDLHAKFNNTVMKEIIDKIVAASNFVISIDDELCRKVNANVHFVIDMGNTKIQRTLSIISHRNKTKSPPKEITLGMDPITFMLLLSGKMQGTEGFMSGKIQFINGSDIAVAIQLQQILGKKLAQLQSGELMNELKASL